MNGGIRLGGQPLAEPPPDLFHLPMFIMQDQPVHDEQRKVVAPMFTAQRLAAMGDLIRRRAGAILDGLPRGETIGCARFLLVTGQMLATLFDVPQEDRFQADSLVRYRRRIGDPIAFETPAGFCEIWKCFEYFNEFGNNAKRPARLANLISFWLRVKPLNIWRRTVFRQYIAVNCWWQRHHA